jgi:hypothetical protein
MTPDELPADMEGLINNVALPWIEAEEVSADPEDLAKAGQAVRALLKAYQEQRRALERIEQGLPEIRAVHRFSEARLIARAALTGEDTAGSPSSQNTEPGLAFSDAGEP